MAIVGVLLAMFVIEPAVVGLAPAVGRFGTFVALSVAASGAPPESAGLGDVDLVAQGLAILALLAWIGAIGAAGGALMRGARRPVTARGQPSVAAEGCTSGTAPAQPSRSTATSDDGVITTARSPGPGRAARSV